MIISNCVVNLSPDKDAVLPESSRLLLPAGRFAVSDIVLLRDIPTSCAGWFGCGPAASRAPCATTSSSTSSRRPGSSTPSVEVTRRYTRDDLASMAEVADVAQLPDGMSVDELVDALDGAFASAFVRAGKP